MNKHIKILLFVISLLAVFSPASAEEIQNYETDIVINADATIDVKEKILYDFGQEQRHGIYRDIPYKYNARGGIYTVKIGNISVNDEQNQEYVFSTSRQGNNIRIKIGDSNVFVSGQKTYIISYKVKKAINYFEDHDELYWNAIGGNWPVDIKNSLVKISFPENNNTTHACYYGQLNSQTPCFVKKQGNQLIIEHNQTLLPEDYLTVVVGLAKGTLYEPSALENVKEKILDNIIVVLPLAIFVFLYFKWYKQGRDPKGRGVIIAQYGPLKDLSPLESATLINESFAIKNIPAEIISLAIKGYLKIERKGTTSVFSRADYLLIKTKEPDDSINQNDKTLLNNIFKNKQEAYLSKITAEDLEVDKLEEKTFKSLTDNEYFSANPKKVKLPYIVIGILLIFVSFFFLAIGFLWFFSVLISGISTTVFGMIMPRKTPEGVEAKEYLLGLKKYIALAEIRRIEFHNAPEKTPRHFEELLPFAMIFGLEKEWAEQFKGMTYSPTWYNDSQMATFNSVVFANNLKSFSSAGTSSFAPASGGSSGFGGGAGGGFGGGGGGSW